MNLKETLKILFILKHFKNVKWKKLKFCFQLSTNETKIYLVPPVTLSPS